MFQFTRIMANTKAWFFLHSKDCYVKSCERLSNFDWTSKRLLWSVNSSTITYIEHGSIRKMFCSIAMNQLRASEKSVQRSARIYLDVILYNSTLIGIIWTFMMMNLEKYLGACMRWILLYSLSLVAAWEMVLLNVIDGFLEAGECVDQQTFFTFHAGKVVKLHVVTQYHSWLFGLFWWILR